MFFLRPMSQIRGSLSTPVVKAVTMRVGDVLKFILELCRVLYVITKTLTGLVFASLEVP